MVLDIMGLCNFCGPALPAMEMIARLLSKAMGRDVSVDEVLEMGRNALRIELEFNKAAGFTKADDRIPEFFKKESLEPRGLVFDVQDADLDEVFKF
jgi:aldehyde:ferredoxin oxidoreductase